MTCDQERTILKAAANACGKNIHGWQYHESCGFWHYKGFRDSDTESWNPLTNPLDTAEMCAEIPISSLYGSTFVECREVILNPCCVDDFEEIIVVDTCYKDHSNSRLKAWMHAATMVAAKIGGYE